MANLILIMHVAHIIFTKANPWKYTCTFVGPNNIFCHWKSYIFNACKYTHLYGPITNIITVNPIFIMHVVAILTLSKGNGDTTVSRCELPPPSTLALDDRQPLSWPYPGSMYLVDGFHCNQPQKLIFTYKINSNNPINYY